MNTSEYSGLHEEIEIMKTTLLNLIRNFSRLWSDKSGNIAIITAVVAMPILMTVGTAIDFAMLSRAQSSLQEIADSAALAAATEFGLTSGKNDTIEEAAKAFVYANDPKLKVIVNVDYENQQVEVNLAKFWQPMLLHHVNKNILPIRTTSIAKKTGSNNLCILALDEEASGSLSIDGISSISAKSCSVYSNSNSSKGIVLASNAKLTAKSICSAGGYSGQAKSLSPKPLVDCPPVPDPLANRPYPSSMNCDHKKTVIANSETVLNPGNYCLGVHITGKSDVLFRPGLYRFINGPLIVDGHSKISGEYITLQFSGPKSHLHFANSSTIELSAMKSGPTTGILIMADKKTSPHTVFKIQSEDAKEFTGLVYLPHNKVEIGADINNGDSCAKAGGPHGPKCKHPWPYCDTSFGQFSDWTAIVSKNIKINDGVTLVMNADYKNSDVPVPSGIGTTGGILRLVK